MAAGQAGEEFVFDVALCLRGKFELSLTGFGKGDDVSAPIGRVSIAREVTGGFERVEQRDQDARVNVHSRPEFALGHPSAIVQQTEKVELSRRELVLRVSGPQSPHRVLAEERERQPLARGPLFQAPDSLVALATSHTQGKLSIRIG